MPTVRSDQPEEDKKRPGTVTFVGVLLAIGAVLNAAIGIALIIEKDVEALQDIFGVTDPNVRVTTGVVELIIAGLLALVAWAIFSGANWARWAVAIVLGVRVAVAGWWLITHLDGGIHWNAILSIAFAVFILWALFGNKESSDYFEKAA